MENGGGIGPEKHCAVILFVEDHQQTRTSIARFLRRAGYCVIEAADGEQAKAFLEAGEVVHLLLTDLDLPGCSGNSVIDHARARSGDLPAVVLTGTADRAQVCALEAQDISVLIKPGPPRRLLSLLDTLLHGVTKAQ